MNRQFIAILSLIGLLISVYLLMHRIGVVGSLACGVSGGCDTVQSSRWATFAGAPVPAWGALGYGLLLAVSVAGVTAAGARARIIPGALLGLATGAFVFSVYLTALEAFVIQAWCRWCIVSAFIATLIFLAALAELPRMRAAAAGTGVTDHE